MTSTQEVDYFLRGELGTVQSSIRGGSTPPPQGPTPWLTILYKGTPLVTFITGPYYE